ncbi:hypothetical protein JCM12141A_30650 [Mycolicibacterium hodleri]
MPWEMRPGPIVRGLLTYVPGTGLRADRDTGHRAEAGYFYELWIKHLTLAVHHGMPRIPRVVAELGPGDSIGAGLSALLSGATTLYALDTTPYTSLRGNVDLFDELVEMFGRRAPRPAAGWPDYDQWLDDDLFPSHILTDELLDRTLAPARVATIRRALLEGGEADDVSIRYVAPWQDASHVAEGTVDFLFSHTVLQHVADLPGTQRCVGQWLAPGGWFSHQIDLGSLNLSPVWNGHRACPEWLWKVVTGRRAWLINRLPYSEHVACIEGNGMQLVTALQRHRRDGIGRERLAPRWRDLSDDDLFCRGAFLQGVRVDDGG